ncbi:MAG: hypothetical protein DRI26_09450 [Chloroflexi bacterium]|nr:MAG: hypothetical protein DRI26_09450 [Chloroflexota bacterium]
MSESFTIATSDGVKRLVGIAQRHLRYITKSRSKGMTLLGDVRPDHAIVASIFSAAAIEVGLNIFIAIPVLYIKDDNIRRFFGLLATKYYRLSVLQKLNFVCEFCPQIKKDKVLLGRVRELFNYRNRLLHSSPEYIEPLGLPDLDFEEFPSEIDEKDLIRRPQLSMRGVSSDEIEAAFEHYQTALDFLSKLTVLRPGSEEST